MKMLTLTILTVFISGCGTTVYVTKPLPLPEPLTEIKVPKGSLDCVSDEGKKALIRRDRVKDERIQTLRDIIKSTH
jgi:hypothetical protein